MAIVKAINSKSSIKNIINYVSDNNKTDEKLMSGKDCSADPNQAIEDMTMTKELYNKTNGRQYKHFVQSFNPNDDITPEKAHEIGKEWAEKSFKGYEVFIATHTDKEHLHNHFVVNSVNYEIGEKLRYSSRELQRYKEISDKICERENISRTLSDSKDITTFDMKKYKAIEKDFKGQKKSYIVEIGKTVEKNIHISRSKEEFINNMGKEGYKVKWSETRKNVTFEDKEGHKVRSENLAKTFKQEEFKKEEMLKQFEKNMNNEKQIAEDLQIKEEKLNTLKGQVAELEKVRSQLKILKEEKETLISDNTRDKGQIEKLRDLISKENEKKKGLGLGIFKKNKIEKQYCDDRINKYMGQIEVINNSLMPQPKLTQAQSEVAEITEKINWTIQKIIEYNEQIKQQNEQIKKAEELLEKERQQREREEGEKKERIPSNLRDKDNQENKKRVTNKQQNKEIINRSSEHER